MQQVHKVVLVVRNGKVVAPLVASATIKGIKLLSLYESRFFEFVIFINLIN